MSERSTWWLAGGAALVVLALVVGLLTWRFEAVSTKPDSGLKSAPASTIGLSRLPQTGTGDLVAEEALFLDPSPLFLPTEWNVDQKTLPSSVLRDPGQMFQDFAARLVFKRDALALNLPEVMPVLQKPADVMSSAEELIRHSGLGERDIEVPVLPRRGGFIEVVSANNGRIVLREPLAMEGLPTDLWRPIELSGVINAAGLVGRMSVVGGAGEGELDQRIRDHVVNSLHLGQRLAPGFYRIFVGP